MIDSVQSPKMQPGFHRSYVPKHLPSVKGTDPGASKKEFFFKSSTLSKTGIRSKGSSIRFQRCFFHLKQTPYEKVIAFCCIDETCKFGKMGVPHGTTGRVTCGIHIEQMDDMEVVRIDMWQYGPIRMRHVSCMDDEVAIQSAVRTNPNVKRVSTEVTA